MLIGNDISHHNYPFQVGFSEFQIFKATEGRTFTDPNLKDYLQQVKKDALIGFYHYARPDTKGNTPEIEAQHFVETIKEYVGRAVLVLDWEGTALLYNDDYAVNWLLHVEALTGVRPIIYTGSWATSRVPNVAKYGYELWVAHYNVKSPTIHNFKDWRMWQFTSKPFDLNIFRGTVADWNYLCKVKR